MTTTIAALAVFDAGAAERELAWYTAMTNGAVEGCVARDKEAEDLVRRAYLEDTKDLNRWSAVKCMPIRHIRRTLQGVPGYKLDERNE
jgi:hypothetical protein